MAPPSYVDLGKLAHDILNKGYHIGFWRFDCNTKTKQDLIFSTMGKSEPEAGKVSGSLATRFSLKDYGLNFMEKWETENNLVSEITCQDKLAEGLKLGLEAKYGIKTGELEGKFKLGYGQEQFQFNMDCKFESSPTINASIVVGYESFLAGYQTAFDSGATALSFNNFALGYTTPELVITIGLDNAENLWGSIFHHNFEKWDFGLEAKFESEASNTVLDFGVKYQMEDSCIRAKVNTEKELYVGYQRKLHEGIEMFLSARSDMKFGIGLELEA